MLGATHDAQAQARMGKETPRVIRAAAPLAHLQLPHLLLQALRARGLFGHLVVLALQQRHGCLQLCLLLQRRCQLRLLPLQARQLSTRGLQLPAARLRLRELLRQVAVLLRLLPQRRHLLVQRGALLHHARQRLSLLPQAGDLLSLCGSTAAGPGGATASGAAAIVGCVGVGASDMHAAQQQLRAP